MNNEEKILELLTAMQADMTAMQADMTAMQVDITALKRDSATKDDITAITQRLEEIDQRSIRTQVLMETDITDRLQLLYEGHKTIMGKLDELTPKTRMEALEDTVDMLKDVIKLMRQDISELKKAQ